MATLTPIGQFAGGGGTSLPAGNNDQLLQMVAGAPDWVDISALGLSPQADLTAETAARIAADATKADAADLTAETAARIAADATKADQTDLTAEVTARTAADASLNTLITALQNSKQNNLPNGTDGQHLTLVSGAPVWEDIPEELPPYSAANGEWLLRVNPAGNGVHWQQPHAVTQFRGSVADSAALATISTPADGDVAITQDDGHIHVYEVGPPAAWSDIGPSASIPASQLLPAGGNDGELLLRVGGVPTWAVPPTPGVNVHTATGETPATNQPAASTSGDFFVNTADGLVWVYDGAAWQSVVGTDIDSKQDALGTGTDGQFLSLASGAPAWTDLPDVIVVAGDGTNGDAGHVYYTYDSTLGAVDATTGTGNVGIDPRTEYVDAGLVAAPVELSQVYLDANTGNDPAAATAAGEVLDPATVTLVEGDVFINTVDSLTWLYDGAAWQPVGGGGGGATISTAAHNMLKADPDDPAVAAASPGMWSRPVIPLTQTEYNGLGTALDADILYVITGP